MICGERPSLTSGVTNQSAGPDLNCKKCGMPTVRIDVFDKLVVTNFFSQLGSPNPFFGTASEFEEHNGAAHSRPNNDVRPFARWVNMRRKDDFLALVINKKIPIVCFGEESFLCLGPGLRNRWFLARTNKVVVKSFSLVQLSDEFLKGGFNVGKNSSEKGQLTRMWWSVHFLCWSVKNEADDLRSRSIDQIVPGQVKRSNILSVVVQTPCCVRQEA